MNELFTKEHTSDYIVAVIGGLVTRLLVELSMSGWNPGALVARQIMGKGEKLVRVIMPPTGVRVPDDALELFVGMPINTHIDGGPEGTVQTTVYNGTNDAGIVEVYGFQNKCDDGPLVPILADIRHNSDGLPVAEVHPIQHLCDVTSPEPSATFHVAAGDTLHVEAVQLQRHDLASHGIPHIDENAMLFGLVGAVEPIVGSAKLQVAAAILAAAGGLIGAGIRRVLYNRTQGKYS